MFYTWVFSIYVGSHSVGEQKWCIIIINHTVRLTDYFDNFFWNTKKLDKSYFELINTTNMYDFVYVWYILKIFDFRHTKIIYSLLQFKFWNSNSYLYCICSLIACMQTSLASASLEKKKNVANLFFPGVIDQGGNYYNRIVTWSCSACPSRKNAKGVALITLFVKIYKLEIYYCGSWYVSVPPF